MYFLVLALAGCNTSGPAVHPVKGQIQLAGGDNSPLAGHIVEIALASDPLVRASGEIKPDGKFQLEALLEGQLRKGAPEGKYLARIVLADDDPQVRNAAAAAIDPRHLKFDTSGLSLQVPVKEPVQLQVLRR
jgi:hypothetical protein